MGFVKAVCAAGVKNLGPVLWWAEKGHQERNCSPILAARVHALAAVSQLVSTAGNRQLVCKDEG